MENSSSTPASTRALRRRRSWTPEEKSRLVGEAQKLQSDGLVFSRVCERLGLSRSQLRVWMRKHPSSPSTGFRRVEVVEPKKSASEIAVVFPSGVRLVGLDLEAALALVERLR